AALAASSGGRVEILACDVTDADGVRALAAELEGRAVDHLVFNAGIHGPRDYPMAEFDEAAWMEVMRVNAMAPLRFAGRFADHVAAGVARVMAFLSSRRGSMAENTWGGHYIYGSSKAVLILVVRSLSIELAARGTACVALTPGWVRTDMGGANAAV